MTGSSRRLCPVCRPVEGAHPTKSLSSGLPLTTRGRCCCRDCWVVGHLRILGADDGAGLVSEPCVGAVARLGSGAVDLSSTAGIGVSLRQTPGSSVGPSV